MTASLPHGSTGHCDMLLGTGLLVLTLLAAHAGPPLLGPEAEPAPIRNGSFEEGGKGGVPTGWAAYKRASDNRRRELVQRGGQTALLLVDDDTGEEIGVQQRFPLAPGRYYEVSLAARAVAGRDARSVYFQLRFLPSGKRCQAEIEVSEPDVPVSTYVGGVAPPDTAEAIIYIYSLKSGTPSVIVDDVELRGVACRDFDEVTEPRARVPQTVLVREGRPDAIIVTPAGEEWQSLARNLGGQLKQALGVTFPIRTEVEATDDTMRETTALLLGHIGVNRAMLYPYSHSLCFPDSYYPGPGGYDLRTVHDPWGTGRNLVVVGSSDVEGASRAVTALLEALPALAPDVSLPPILKTELAGDAASRYGSVFTRKLDEKWIQAQHADAETQLERGIHCGLFSLASRYGEWYALSRRPEYASMFVWMIRRAYTHFKSNPSTYGGPWGMDSDFRIYRIIPQWDAVEECPALSDQDRLEVTRILFKWVSDLDHKGRARGNAVRFNHITFPALGCLYAGQYFARYDGVLQSRIWTRQAHEVFRFQAATTKPHCDCNSYHWLPIHHTMLYSLATGDITYFDNGCLRRMADYMLLSVNNLGYPVAYGDIGLWRGGGPMVPVLRGAAWFRQEPQLTWMMDTLEGGRPRPGIGQYITDRGTARAPEELLGTVAWPLTEAWHRTFDGERHVRLEQTVDKICFRETYESDGAYLLLDGLGAGGHGHKDANAVLQWCEDGRIWLTDGDYIKSLPKVHNTMLVLKDGQSVLPPPFCELRNATDLPGLGYSRTLLRDYAGVDWERHVVRLKGRWFAVVDSLTANEAGDYSFRAVWQTVGKVHLEGAALDVEQKGRHARIAFAEGTHCLLHDDEELGNNWKSYPHADTGTIRVLQGIVTASLAAGEQRELATLLHAAGEAASSARIEALGPGAYRVTDEHGPALLRIGGTAPDLLLPGTPVAEADATVLTGRMLWAANAAIKDLPRADVELDLRTGQAAYRHPPGLRPQPLPPVATKKTGLRPPVSADLAAALATSPPTPPAQAGADARPALARIPVLWSVRDEPATLVVSGNAGTFGRVDAEMALACTPKPLETNVFSGAPGANRPGNMLDGQLQGTPGATMWDADREVTIDLIFPREFRLAGIDLHAWFATGSSKGKSYRLAKTRLETSRDGFANDTRLLHEREERDDHPSWGSPVLYTFGPFDEDVGQLRLTLTPRQGSGVYVAELVVRGDGPWLRERLSAGSAPRFASVAAVDVDGDGRSELAAGSSSGAVLCLNASGERLWRADFGAPVRAVAGIDFAGDGRQAVVAGGARESVAAFGPDGVPLWTYDIPRYKTSGHVNLIFPADLDGSGKQIAVAGSRNWRFHVLGADGSKRWHYESVHPSTAGVGADLDGDGRQELLLGTAYYWWHAVSPDGSKRWGYRTAGGPGCNVVAVGDVTGDDVPEVFFGGQDALVQAADAKGRRLWQFNTGDEVTGLVLHDTDGDGRCEVFAASLSFNLFSLNGDGSVRWRTDLEAPLRRLCLADVGGSSALVVGTDDGRVVTLTPADGKLQSEARLHRGVVDMSVAGSAAYVSDASGGLCALDLAGTGRAK